MIVRECMMPRSRSLEIFSDPATWSRDVEEILLTKGEAGLGFSILDYQVILLILASHWSKRLMLVSHWSILLQDPVDASNSVIVVRGLVPGGAAMQVNIGQ